MLLCSWMPGSRVVSCLLVMRGNVGGIMGRWRCLRCCPHHTANLPRTAAELAAAAETLAFPTRCRGYPCPRVEITKDSTEGFHVGMVRVSFYYVCASSPRKHSPLSSGLKSEHYTQRFNTRRDQFLRFKKHDSPSQEPPCPAG